ncbi:hypothetical protein ABXS97_12120, partial [Flavobacterium psychrophilum]
VAKKQINENTDIRFDYKLTKVRSRSYNTIHLYIDSLKPEQLKLFASDVPNFEINPEMQRRIKHIEASGLSPEIAQLWALKYYKEFVAEKNNLLEGIANKKITLTKDIPSYLRGVFNKKGWV